MTTTKPKKDTVVEKKLIGMADIVIHAADRSKDPTFQIPIRALSNVSFNDTKGLIEMGEQETGAVIFQRRHGEEVHADDARRRCPLRVAAG